MHFGISMSLSGPFRCLFLFITEVVSSMFNLWCCYCIWGFTPGWWDSKPWFKCFAFHVVKNSHILSIPFRCLVLFFIGWRAYFICGLVLNAFGHNSWWVRLKTHFVVYTHLILNPSRFPCFNMHFRCSLLFLTRELILLICWIGFVIIAFWTFRLQWVGCKSHIAALCFCVYCVQYFSIFICNVWLCNTYWLSLCQTEKEEEKIMLLIEVELGLFNLWYFFNILYGDVVSGW